MKASLGLIALASLATAAPLAEQPFGSNSDSYDPSSHAATPEGEWPRPPRGPFASLPSPEGYEPVPWRVGPSRLSAFRPHAPLFRPGVEVILNPSSIRPLNEDEEIEVRVDYWRPSGRIGAFLDSLGISPVVEWSRHPKRPRPKHNHNADDDIEVEKDHHTQYGGRSAGRLFGGKRVVPDTWGLTEHLDAARRFLGLAPHPTQIQVLEEEEGEEWQSPTLSDCTHRLGNLVTSGYNALGDRRTYAAVMLLVAAMNLTSIILVLTFFRGRGRGRIALDEEDGETVREQGEERVDEKHDV